jgi:hypothetical protein
MEEIEAEWAHKAGKDAAVWAGDPPQARADFASARNAGEKNPMNVVCPASSGNARSAGL